MIGIVPGRATVAAAAVCILLSAACEDEIPPEQRVTAVEVASGDNQQAEVGTTLAQPLVVRAVDSQGRPVRGAPVEWQVAAAGGTISPIDERTDTEGLARANWTIGTTAVQLSATARIGTATALLRATGTPGPAATITITPGTVMLDAIGASADLQVLLRDQYDNPITDRDPAWSSTDESIVRVDADGSVTATGPGTATVRASLDSSTGEAQVTVAPVPTSIAIVPPTALLTAVGATQQLEALAQDRNGNPVEVPAENYTWTTSNPLVATVSLTGLVSAAGAGDAVIRATFANAVGEALVSVIPTVAALVVTPQTDTLTTARLSVQLAATATDTNGLPIPNAVVMWTTSDATIATVSATGLVGAIRNGTVIIRATSGMASDSARIVVRLNTPPVPVADDFATGINTALGVPAPGVLANDTLGIPAATVASFGGGDLGGNVTDNVAGSTAMFGTGGSITVFANGSVNFTPSTGFNGTFTFQYRIINFVGTSVSTVSIHVGTAPTAVDDAYSTPMGVTLTVPIAGPMDNDDRGFPLANVTSFGGFDVGGAVTTYAAGLRVAFGIGNFFYGFVRLNPDGTLEFTPPPGFTGTVRFRYRITNPIGSSDATVTVTVT